jgi:peptidoglycan LD-endopeptidase CwlK
MYHYSKRSLKNLEGIHPDLVKVMTEAIKNSPVDFTITDGVRTTAEQQILYAQGRTKPGRIVTNADGIRNKSNHQAKTDGYGYAVDLYPFYGGTVQLNDHTRLRAIADHIKKTAKQLNIKIEWGGDWAKFRDYPHFELKK